MIFRVIGLMLAAILVAGAEEKPLHFDKLLKYEDVTVRKIEPDGIRIMHSGGMTKIPIESLPPEIVAQLGLNQADAAAHREKEQSNNQAAAAAERSRSYLADRRVSLKGRVLQVVKDGLLVADAICETGKKVERRVPVQTQVSGPTKLNPNIPVEYVTSYRIEWVPERNLLPAAFVHCPTNGYLDGSPYEGSAYLFGSYSYQGTDGAQRTVPSFTTDAAGLLAAAGLGLPQGPAATTGIMTGTGFFVSSNGYLLTNHHVVTGRKSIKVIHRGQTLEAKVEKSSFEDDVALLKVEGTFPCLPLGDSQSVPIGRPVFAVGFPQVDVQGVDPKFTEGSISGLRGVEDNDRYFQISVPIQPGNSGSPLVMGTGEVVGIVSATLRNTSQGNDLKINQNVNYAVKIARAKALLPAGLPLAGPRQGALTREGLIQDAIAATVLIKAE